MKAAHCEACDGLTVAEELDDEGLCGECAAVAIASKRRMLPYRLTEKGMKATEGFRGRMIVRRPSVRP
jgi:hypothetical protein